MLPSLSLEDVTVAGGSTTSHPVFRLPEAVIYFAQRGKETRKAFWTPHRHGGVLTEAGGSPSQGSSLTDWQAAYPSAGYQQICCPGTQWHLHLGPLLLLGFLTCDKCHSSKSWSPRVASLLKLGPTQQSRFTHASFCLPKQGGSLGSLGRRDIDLHSSEEGQGLRSTSNLPESCCVLDLSRFAEGMLVSAAPRHSLSPAEMKMPLCLTESGRLDFPGYAGVEINMVCDS